MSTRKRRILLQIGAVVLSLLFGASEVMAGGGGGKRGGGGPPKASASRSGGGGGVKAGASKPESRSKVSKSSPAAGGLGTVKRAQSPTNAGAKARPASTGERKAAQSRPGGAKATEQRGQNQAQRQGSRDDRVAQRDENRDANREDRQDWRDEDREDRQDFREDRQEDRQDFWDDRFDEGNWNDVDWNEVDWDEVEVWDDDDFEWGLGSWMALSVGTALTVAAFDSMRTQPGCELYQVMLEETEYYRCGSTWYIKAYAAGDLRYMAVNPPPGF